MFIDLSITFKNRNKYVYSAWIRKRSIWWILSFDTAWQFKDVFIIIIIIHV